MPLDQFLFINKTAQSTALTNNRNDASLARRVNHHVQPRLKPSRLNDIKSSAHKLVGWWQPSQAGSTSNKSSVARTSAQREADQLCVQEEMVADVKSAGTSNSTLQATRNGVEQRRAAARVEQGQPGLQTPPPANSEARRTGLAPPPFNGWVNHTSCDFNHVKSSNSNSGHDNCLQQPRVILGNKRLRISKARTGANHVSPLDEISGALDPFLRLPLELTLRERSLLQFYLTEGIPLIFLTLPSTLFSGASYIFSLRSSTSANYVITKIIVAEWLHSQLKGSSPSRNFLRRKAEVYRYVNDLVNDLERDSEELLFGLVYLQIMDWTVGNPQIQRMHLQAIDTVLNNNNKGILAVLQGLSHSFYPCIIASQYLYVDLHLKDLRTLEQVKARFFRSLRFVQHWHITKTANDSNFQHKSAVFQSRQQSKHGGTLKRYLDSLIHQLHKDGDDSFVNASGTTALLQQLCLTLAYYNQSRTETALYVELLECYLGGSSQRNLQTGDLLLHPTQAIAIVVYTSNITMGQGHGVDNHDIQSRICADCVDGSKTVQYLSCDTRHSLLTGLVSLAVGEESTFCVSEDMLAEMSAEIATSWWRRNQMAASSV